MKTFYALLQGILIAATTTHKARAQPRANANSNGDGLVASSIIPFGALIDHCVVPGTVALTFDDGPFWYTSGLLDILSEYGAPVTFFVNGHNLGDVYESSEVVQRIVQEGHQLGSHTYLSFLHIHAV